MTHTSAIRFILTGTLVSTSLMLYSCGSDSGPREGTPAFYWQAQSKLSQRWITSKLARTLLGSPLPKTSTLPGRALGNWH